MVWRDIPHFYPIFLLAIARSINCERMCAARIVHGEHDASVCVAMAACHRTCRSGAFMCDGVVKYDRLVPLQNWECVSVRFSHLGISLPSCTMLVPLHSLSLLSCCTSERAMSRLRPMPAPEMNGHPMKTYAVNCVYSKWIFDDHFQL